MLNMPHVLVLVLPGGVKFNALLELGVINSVILPFTSRDLTLHHHVNLHSSVSVKVLG